MTTVVFSANDGTHGVELWVTDGTAGGTHLLKDINPGPPAAQIGSYPSQITSLGDGKVLFTAYDGTNGTALWVTDGTANGTTLVGNQFTIGFPQDLTAIGDGEAMFNTGTSGFWTTDGTPAGTTHFGSSYFSPANYITSLGNGTALFTAVYSNTHNSTYSGDELWVGSPSSISIVKNINPANPNGPYGYPYGGSDPKDLTALGNGEVLFSAYDGQPGHGRELWVTDGHAFSTATSLVDDINPGSGSSNPQYITALGNGQAVFAANNGTNGTELWVTNGTQAGTRLVDDINSGSGSSNPQDITALGNGKALFSADQGSGAPYGRELWVTDGTSDHTYRLKDINPDSLSSNPTNITALGNGKAVFSAYDNTYGRELWVTDGTSNGTYRLKDINPTGSSNPNSIFALVPCRDLLVTPDHALLVDDVLIQAGALVNGTSIVRERDVPERVTYYHVELDDHSLLLAENTPAETFVDNADRLAFNNWAEHEALNPHGKPIVEMPYPRAKSHRQVPRAMKRRLEARAAELYEGILAVA